MRARALTVSALVAGAFLCPAAAQGRDIRQLSVEPPDVAAELGAVPTPLPERWIAAAEPGTTREYYEDILEYGADDTAVRGHLVISGDAAGKPQRFELTEFHLRVPRRQPTTLSRTTTSTGRIVVEQAAGERGAVAVYKLIADAPASRTLTFVKAGTRLALAAGAAGQPIKAAKFGQTLVATATPQTVTVTNDADAAMKWKVRLRTGQQLDVRLAPLSAGRRWELRRGEFVGALTARAGSTAPVPDATQFDGRVQVFRYTASAPGWNDLGFEHGILKMTVRVKVEAAAGQSTSAKPQPPAPAPPGWERTKTQLQDLVLAGDSVKAIAIAEKIVAAHPRFGEGHARLGGAHEMAARDLARSNVDAALKHLDLAELHLRHAFELGGGEYPEATIRGLIDLYEYARPSETRWKAAVNETLARYPGEPVAHWYGVQLLLRENRVKDLDASFRAARAALTSAEPRVDYASLIIGLARDAQPAVKTALIKEAVAIADEVSKGHPGDRVLRRKADLIREDAARLQPK